MTDAMKALVEAARDVADALERKRINDGERMRLVRLREALAAVERAGLGTPWQCSGCRRVFFGRHREVCPGCGREGYWTGSVEPVARAAAEDAALAERAAGVRHA